MSRSDSNPTVEPTCTESARGTTFDHPAYGQISVGRVSGSAMLYGSDFKHSNYIALRVRRSALTRSLSADWPHAREELIEIHMSESQWATMICSLNIGEGVQCTLDTVMGEKIPGLPRQVPKRHDQYAKENAIHMATAMAGLEKAVELLEGSGLSKAKQSELVSLLRKAHQDIGVNQDFVAKSFGEHMEDTTQKAKVEINAWGNNLLRGLGIERLSQSQLPIDFSDAGVMRLPEEGKDNRE